MNVDGLGSKLVEIDRELLVLLIYLRGMGNLVVKSLSCLEITDLQLSLYDIC